MIRYLKHIEIDKKRWDECIAGAENRLIYALSWYLDIVSPHWDALIMDDYRAVMPLTWKKKFGLKYLVQPAFCQQLGVFGIQGACINTVHFIEKIPFRFLRARIQFNSSNFIEKNRLRLFGKINYELSLNKTYTELFNNYSTIHKKNIKTGRNRHITLNYSTDVSKFWDFFMKNHEAKFRLNEGSYIVLKKLIHEVSVKARYTICFAHSENNEPAAAMYLMNAFNRWILLFSPSTNFGSRNRAVYLLIDNFIKEHAEQNEILDFEGSGIKGIAEFYRGFGAKENHYQFLASDRLPILR